MDDDGGTKMNIFQRLNEIKKEVAYIRKDKKVESYMAVTHDAVTAETREIFIKHGVMIVPKETDSVTKDTGTVTAKGTPFIRFEAKYDVCFVNIDEPSDMACVSFTAHALDHGDKAPGKAHSYAVKYAILKVLQIETGEAEEGREEQKAPKKESFKSIGKAELDGFSAEEKKSLIDLHTEVMDLWNPLMPQIAYDQYAQIRDNLADEAHQIAFRGLFDSKVRTAFTKIYQEHRKTELAGQA